MEQIAEAVNIVLWSCISEKIFDQTVNAVHLSEVLNIFGKIDSCFPWSTFLDVPIPRMIELLVKVPTNGVARLNLAADSQTDL